jgi:hypothetical protein
MSYVATLVCDPSPSVLTGELVARARKASTNPASLEWLASGTAADITFVLSSTENARISIVLESQNGNLQFSLF